MKALRSTITLSNSIGILSFSIVIFLIYRSVTEFSFIWDDQMFIVDMNMYPLEKWREIFSSAFFVSENYYRPLATLSFSLERALWDASPGPMHLTNVLIHFLNCLMLYFSARTLIRINTTEQTEHVSQLGAIIATVFFAAHPANIESVAWISGRFDLLFSFFMLALITAEICLRDTLIKFLLVATLYLLAALCKEMAAGAILFMPLLHIVMRRFSWPRDKNLRQFIADNRSPILFYSALLLGGTIYLYLRYKALGYLLAVPGDYSSIWGTTWQHALLSAKSAFLYTVSSLFDFIFSSPIHKEEFPLLPDDRIAILGGIACIAIFVTCIVMAIKYNRLWLLLPAFYGALVPVLHFSPLPVYENIIHERFLYFPLTFFCTFFGYAIAGCFFSLHIRKRVKAAIGLFVSSIVLASIYYSILTINFWRDNNSLWHWAYQRAPNSTQALVNLSGFYSAAGNCDKAIELAEKSMALDPDSLGTHTIASCLIETAPEKSIQYIKEILSKPKQLSKLTLVSLLNTLALAYKSNNEVDKAIEVYKDVLEEVPDWNPALWNIGIAYAEKCETESANSSWRKAIEYAIPARKPELSKLVSQINEKWIHSGCDPVNRPEPNSRTHAIS